MAAVLAVSRNLDTGARAPGGVGVDMHMVNKGSFFQRLKDRFGTGSVKVDARGAAPRSNDRGVDPRTAAGLDLSATPKPAATKPTVPPAPKAPVAPVAPAAAAPAAPAAPAPAPAPAAPAPARVEPEREARVERLPATDFAPADIKSTRKLSEREEAMVALGSHFQELTSLLRGSQARTDAKLDQLVTAATALATLPALSQQQLDMLRLLSTYMERQQELGEQVAGTLTTLPALLQNVETALARAAATDERTASTVREFQATMDRIHGSMAQMVAHSDQQAAYARSQAEASQAQAAAAQQLAARRDDGLQELANGLSQTQQAAAKELQRTTEESLQALRRTNEDQSNRLQRVISEHASWNRAVLVGLAVLGVGVLGLVLLQLLR